MKKLLICMAAFVFLVGASMNVQAQKRGKGGREKAIHHHVKHDHHARHDHKYKDKHKHAYLKIKHKEVHHRGHDKWYNGKRFHRHRTEYVYFPAYRTYYDPYRRGYVYMHNHAWVFAPTMPSFMLGLNFDAVQVQFAAQLPL